MSTRRSDLQDLNLGFLDGRRVSVRRRADGAFRRALVVGALSAIAGGCTHPKTPATAAMPADYAISQSFFDYFVWKRTGVAADQVPRDRKALLFTDLQKLDAAARGEASKISPDVEHELELQRLETLAHAAAVSAGVFAPPSDSELNAAYERFRSALPAREYHVAHILVATEGMADTLIVRLQAGEAFARLAQDKSADDSRSRGGDIGWIAPGKLPVAFTDAVTTLAVGEFTRKPVHTNYGWHVIRLIETRPSNAPPFEQVKAQLVVNLQQERYQAFLDRNLKSVASK